MSHSSPVREMMPSSGLNDVLEALRNSSKLKHWNQPLPSDTELEDNPLKHVGDISIFPANPKFSFGDEEEDENDIANILKTEYDREEKSSPIILKTEDPFIDIGLEAPVDVTFENYMNYQHNLYHHMEQLQLEEDYKKQLQENSFRRHQKYTEQLSQIREEAEQQLENYISQREQQSSEELLYLQQQELQATQETIKKENEYEQRQAERTNKLREKVQEAQAREAEQAKERMNLLNNLQASQTKFQKMLEDIHKMIRDLHSQVDNKITSKAGELTGHLNKVYSNVSAVLEGKTDLDLEQLEQLKQDHDQSMLEVDHLSQTLCQKKAEIEAAAVAEKERQQQEAVKQGDEFKQQQQQQQQQQQEEQITAAVTTAVPFTSPTDPSPSQDMGGLQSSTQDDNNQLPSLLLEAIKKGDDLKLSLQEFEDAAQRVNNSDKMDLKKALAMLNQFNAGNPTNNRDKLSKVIMLLSGRPIVYGDKSIGTDNQPDKVKFVQNNVALQIIKIGHDKQATNTVNIGMYAWVIVNVWKAFPVMGNLFLHRFYETCPYLLPRSVTQNPGQSEEDFYKNMGYRFTSEACEKQDNFVTRMGAAAQLYGLVVALMAKYKIGVWNAPQEGWLLISGFLSLPPTSAVTAAVLHNFLIGAGAMLTEVYGQQFRKLMEYTYSVFLCQIEAVTGAGGQQPLNQLKQFLDKYKSTGQMAQPEGLSNYTIVT